MIFIADGWAVPTRMKNMPIAAHPAAGRPEGEQQDDGQAVLVFGATGQQGRATAKALRSRGCRVRAMVRNPASPKALELSTLGVELVPGDLADIASMRRAMTGVDGVFSVQPNSGQDPAGGLTDQDEVRYAADIAQLAVEQNVLEAFSENLALEVEPFGLRVRLVIPGRAPETSFSATARSRSQHGVPQAYADWAKQVFSAAPQPVEVTTALDVAEAVWKAVTDVSSPLRIPAGSDAMKLAGQVE